jgi:acyl dehydratase
MPLNRALIGKEYSAPIAEVALDAIQRYARACNDGNPRYFDAATPGGIIAPPMFAVVVTWMPVISAMTDPELHADLLRLLHSAQDMECLAPIRPGDQIAARAKIASIEKSPGGETMKLRLEASNQRDEPVSRITFTVFIRGRREPGGQRAAAATTSAEEIRGDPIVTVTQALDADQTFRYAEASGDRNPIHIDENVAKMAGLPGIVVHGLCTMAFTAKAIADHLCVGDPIRLKRLAVNFSRPVFPGDSITTRVWAGGAREGRRVYLYETLNPRGFAVIRGGVAEVSA